MSAFGEQSIRCAIYTRRSVGYSEEQEFNSLESQRAICSSYIASQLPKGWHELPKKYDDMGRSGANLERPAMQDLLSDIESGLIDVIVIYKLDRITRTLLDFVRLIDLLEQYGVSFVSVTQNFDTADSTGRLILNILLTFAQFEREISSDRLRDKFQAMKQRGMFVGGNPPYGFDLIDKKLVPNPEEAKLVRSAFKNYLKFRSLPKVALQLRADGAKRRNRVSKRGNLVHGRGICTGAVLNMLRNPIYVGDVRYKEQVYPGLQRPIVSRALWDDVQALRAERTRAKVVEKHQLDLLRGLIFDAYGRSVGVFRDYRHQTKSRYYLSNQSEWGRRHGVRRYRTKADAFDKLVIGALTSLLANRDRVRPLLITCGIHDGRLNKLAASGAAAARKLEDSTPRQAQCAIRAIVSRIDVSDERVQIVIRSNEIARFLTWTGMGLFRGDESSWGRPHCTELLDISVSAFRIKRDVTNILERRKSLIKGRPDKYLLSLFRRARRAQSMLDLRYDGTYTQMAAELQCTHSRLPRLLRLNYLAPDIIAAILDGNQPPGLNGRALMANDLPMDWALQRRLLGFADQPDTLRAAPGW